jgi:hypothetical protein
VKQGLSQIGPAQREEHFHLRPEHRCYYWGEYTAWPFTHGQNAEFSEANRLIADLKIAPELRSDATMWARKGAAIERVSEAFSRFWKWRDLADKAILVPMPTSRSSSDPLQDDRMDRVVDGICARSAAPLMGTRLLVSDGSLHASHSGPERPKLKRLAKSIHLVPDALPAKAPGMVFLFDDVLTTGAHFIACSARIREAFPASRIIGTFVARTKRPAPQAR